MGQGFFYDFNNKKEVQQKANPKTSWFLDQFHFTDLTENTACGQS